ncbi:hypothetical protein [Baekduia alba]|uniref:hypothetical protein n=1 Tax=Baekduia alba TaxID=2997333 RepID=UPI00234028CB|nr:hypothetical protein [Baekduia alba]
MPLGILVGLVIAIGVVRAHRVATAPASGGGRVVDQVNANERAATFTFDPSIAPGDRTAILTAVSHANPQAQALVAEVDGLVNVHVGSPGGSAVGLTASRPDGRYDVTLDLGLVWRRYAQRGIDRVVLHELGHVVDFALVPEALDKTLDARIPAGYGCDEQLMGSCAAEEERFAESFAKWATGDIGVDLYLGYKVPPPDDLSAWGAPLAKLLG